MKDDFLQLFRERIVSVLALRNETSKLSDLTALGFICQSGKKFEIWPTITDIKPLLEIFEISIRLVETFRELHQWPNGPKEEWEELKEITKIIGNREIDEIHLQFDDQGFLDDEVEPGRIGFTLIFEDNRIITFRHDHGLPGSIFIQTDIEQGAGGDAAR